MKLKTAVLISGNGGNLQALINAANADNNYPAEISLVISNKLDAYGLVRAEKSNIRTSIIDHKRFKTRDGFDHEIHSQLIQNKIDVVCLAGFMRILTPDFVIKWHGRMINIHPSLLPSFRGGNAVRDALDYGVKITGCTVHQVIPEVDSGKILVQRSVEISENDTVDSVADKIHIQEHIAYPEALKKLCSHILANR